MADDGMTRSERTIDALSEVSTAIDNLKAAVDSVPEEAADYIHDQFYVHGDIISNHSLFSLADIVEALDSGMNDIMYGLEGGLGDDDDEPLANVDDYTPGEITKVEPERPAFDDPYWNKSSSGPKD